MAMKPEDVALQTEVAQAVGGSKHDLWIGGASGGEVLTITIDKHSRQSPPRVEQCRLLNGMIQSLARAVRSVTYHANNDSSLEAEFVMSPIEDIADAIVILSQLSEAICVEAAT